MIIYNPSILDHFNLLLILIKNKQKLKKINTMMKFPDLKDFLKYYQQGIFQNNHKIKQLFKKSLILKQNN